MTRLVLVCLRLTSESWMVFRTAASARLSVSNRPSSQGWQTRAFYHEISTRLRASCCCTVSCNCSGKTAKEFGKSTNPKLENVFSFLAQKVFLQTFIYLQTFNLWKQIWLFAMCRRKFLEQSAGFIFFKSSVKLFHFCKSSLTLYYSGRNIGFA